jgi:hypothetical protein
MVLAPGLGYLEFSVGKEDIGYGSGGIKFYVGAYSFVVSMPSTELSYVVGSNSRKVSVDGVASDWGSSVPLVSFQARGITPSELEVSALYVANDAENLYVRIDARGKPSSSIESGTLGRELFIYIDTDNNNDTGYKAYGGADFYVYVSFNARPDKYTYVSYYRYAGTGGDSKLQYVSGTTANANYDAVYEFKVPLGLLGLKPQQKIGIYLPKQQWYLYRAIPVPVMYISYPLPKTNTTGTGGTVPGVAQKGFIERFFGSETVFLVLVASVFLVEAAVIVYLARRPQKQLPGAPPPG